MNKGCVYVCVCRYIYIHVENDSIWMCLNICKDDIYSVLNVHIYIFSWYKDIHIFYKREKHCLAE